MQIITADWETYYDKDYSLSKMTTEEYVNDERFEAIMLGMRMPDGKRKVVTGTHEEIKYQLDTIDWSQYAVLCHNTMFDAAIFTWRFGIKPAVWLDTLSMARAMHGVKGNSLAALAKKYKLQDKQDVVHNMLGRRRDSLSPEEFERYARYCLNDVSITWKLFHILSEGWYNFEDMDNRGLYPLQELKLIDQLIRMYSEPVLRLNKERLQAHLAEVVARKEALMEKVSADKDELMSNKKFAEVLQGLGVSPPMKISGTTGKETFAFSKNDEGMKALLEHINPEVQALVAARIGVKSTLEETRTQRFIAMAERSERFPVPLRYSAARTHRLGGSDGINLQNLPSRGAQKNKLKSCIEPPPGYVIIDCDSSNIEARMLAWLAGQDDLVEDFANKVDVYCKMATKIYNREITKADVRERFVGKTVVLGAGYQTGGAKLQVTLKAADPPMEMELQECHNIIQAYRTAYPNIPGLWRQGDLALQAIVQNRTMWFGREGVVRVEGSKGLLLPSGLYIQYPKLNVVNVTTKVGSYSGYEYTDETGTVGIYGGKLTENVVQALARIVVMQQLLRISKKLKVVLTVHDAVAAIAREDEADEARAYVEECMRWVPKWAAGCPINCESGMGRNYGEC